MTLSVPISYALLNGPVDSSRPVVAADLEGTLTAGSAWRGMYRYLLAHGRALEARRLYYSRLPAYFALKVAGRELGPFKRRWIHDMLKLFRGQSQAQFQETAEWMVDRALWPGRRRAVLDELAEHQRRGRRVLIVTGLFEPYLAAFMARLPGYEAIGTPMVFEDGRVTGQLAGPFNVGPRKAEALEPFSRAGQIQAAYGDTFDDRHMLALSQGPVAVWPDGRLRRLAQRQDWRILEAA